MKKKIALLVCFQGILLAALLNAQTTPTTPASYKFYSNYYLGYSGYAYCSWRGTTATDTVQSIFDSVYDACTRVGWYIDRKCHKMSKEEIWLMWQALGEYDLKTGEIYSFSIRTNQTMAEGTYLHLVIVVKDNGQSVDIYEGNYWKIVH